MTVWLCQCLCPDRHAIMAAVGEAESEAEAERDIRAPLRWRVEELLASGAFNPWCALCDANPATWRYEVRRTKFATMDEAEFEMAKQKAANILTNLAIGDLHKTRPN
jgi:hypothetical protein